MADTTRTRSALVTLLADNTTGAITEQTMRDLLASVPLQDSSSNITMPSTQGVGIKVDTTTPVFGWKDLLGEVIVKNSGTEAPVWTTYRGNISQYKMDSGDLVWNNFHLPHDIIPGTDFYIHAHWSQNVGTLSSGAMTWSFDISYAKGYERGSFSAPITVTASTTPTVMDQYEHYISEVKFADSAATGGILDSDNFEVDGLILVRTNWTANTLSPAADPFIHYIDIHYQSTQMATKGRNYPFY